jgi:hypothetical protein
LSSARAPAVQAPQSIEEKEIRMSVRVELACTVCAEEFQVPIGVYRAHAGVVPCPCCGSTDLVLLWEREAGPSASVDAPVRVGGPR